MNDSSMHTQLVMSILNVLKTSDFADHNLRKVDYHLTKCYMDEKSHKILRNDLISTSVSFRDNKSKLSEAWVAGNILVFTMFDSWLEDKYALTEGATFKQHYNEIIGRIGSTLSDLQIIEISCYRILKLIRNAIQHNLSAIAYDMNDGFIIAYTHSRYNTEFLLEISAESITYLYSLIIALIEKRIQGLPDKYTSEGSYLGVMRSYYDKLIAGIGTLNDDIPDSLKNIDHSHLRIADGRRFIVTEPYIVEETIDKVLYHRVCSYYPWEAADYKYKMDDQVYYLPEEIGNVRILENSQTSQENISEQVVEFDKKCITDEWKRLDS
ncbi:MAG: hypothetical protein PHY47_24955 [Lachnospiraceae bacterium]|nr:hypothetical protein [Lachnospiraceae bacterium]